MTAFHVKPIKPANLKIGGVRLELLNALRKEGTVQRNLLKGTVKYWTGEKPKFDEAISLSGGDAQLLIAPTGSKKAVDKWIWLDEGTKPHWIRPVRAKMLRFQPGYDSGSKPGTLKVRPARRYGDYVYAKEVYVKGITGRGWTIVVLKQRYKPFREAMNTALAKGLSRSGWS